MSNRNLLILVIIAAVMVGLAAITSRIENQPVTASATGPAYLIQGLDPDKIDKITIASGKEGLLVTLVRRGKNFFVENLDNYPAIPGEINKLLTTCLDIRTSELYKDDPANFKALDMNEENARLVVKFYKEDSTDSNQASRGWSLLTGIVIGKQREKGSVGYIRRVEDKKVYIMAAQIPWIKKRPTDYVQQQILTVKKEDIELIKVAGPNESYILKPGSNDRSVIMENVPEGKKLNEDTAGRVFNALAELSFEDVNAESSRPGLKFDSRFVCMLKDSTVYTVRLANDGENWFVKCDAQFMDQTPVTKTQGQVETQEQLKKKEAKLIARDAAEEFAENHKGWVYQIPEYLADNLYRTRDDLLEDKSPAVEPNEIQDINSLLTPTEFLGMPASE
jgi:hypothetical protein